MNTDFRDPVRAERTIRVLREAARRAHQREQFAEGTGLPTPALFTDRLRQAAFLCERPGRGLAVAVLEPTSHDAIAETLGFEVLQAKLDSSAVAVSEGLRQSDAVARLREGEIAVLLTNLATPSAARHGVEKVLQMLRRTAADASGKPLRWSAGIAFFAGGGEPPENLLRHARIALRRAADGASEASVVFFDPDQHRASIERSRLLEELRTALSTGELFLEFQPQISLSSRAVVGAEALLRWRHPTRGVLLPGCFIDVVETSALAGPVTSWVLAEIERLASNASDGAGRLLSVNVIEDRLGPPEVAAAIASTAGRLAARGWRLEIELTERTVTNDPALLRDCLEGLRAHGVSVAMDDFGTGFASLAQLADFPIDRVKLDMSLVRGIDRYARRRALASGAVAMLREIGLDIVAEGVETEEELAVLCELGVGAAQGYLLGRPTEFPAAWRGRS